MPLDPFLYQFKECNLHCSSTSQRQAYSSSNGHKRFKGNVHHCQCWFSQVGTQGFGKDWTESLEKAEQGFCQLVHWDYIKASPSENLKISPVAAIPHKSQQFCMILNLSHGIQINKEQMLSVNEVTDNNLACQLTLWQNSGMSFHASYIQLEWNMSPRDPSYSVNWTSRMDTGEWWSQ